MNNVHSNADRQFGVFTKLLASNVQVHKGGTTPSVITATGLRRIADGFARSVSAAELEPAALATDELAAIAIAAWRQYDEVGRMLERSARALRNRMSAPQYAQLLKSMPGFAI
jgi:hypothetical protein